MILEDWRNKAKTRFAFPTRKEETFQSMPLEKLRAAWPALALPVALDKEQIAHAILPECSHLVFVDGFFDAALSQIPEGVICLPLDKAVQSYGAFLQNRWTRNFREETDPFCHLNAANHGKGAFLYVPPGKRIEEPLQILQITTGSSLASPRLQITLGKEASLSIVQTFLSFVPHFFLNGAADCTLDAGSQLQFSDLSLHAAESWSLFALRATLKRDAELKAMHATAGSQSVRFSAVVELAEEHASLHLQGLSLLHGERQSHFHAMVDHAAPHCTSRTAIKSVLHQNSKSSFEGKIFVRPVAQKTEAYQLNNNLLLSDTAVAHTKPNLEIFADDVKASHGATVSQVSPEELFYLRSRGLSEQEARSLLTRGFCQESIDQFPHFLRQPLFALMDQLL